MLYIVNARKWFTWLTGILFRNSPEKQPEKKKLSPLSVRLALERTGGSDEIGLMESIKGLSAQELLQYLRAERDEGLLCNIGRTLMNRASDLSDSELRELIHNPPYLRTMNTFLLPFTIESIRREKLSTADLFARYQQGAGCRDLSDFDLAVNVACVKLLRVQDLSFDQLCDLCWWTEHMSNPYESQFRDKYDKVCRVAYGELKRRLSSTEIDKLVELYGNADRGESIPLSKYEELLKKELAKQQRQEQMKALLHST